MTTVKDTVYRSDGTPASGTVVITWPAFVTGDSKAVFGGTKTLPLTNGALAVALAPNSGATPSGTSYQVKYFQSGGVFFEETWVVPTSSPLASPGAPTVSNIGTPGSKTYYYWVTATNANGETLLSASGLTTTANNTLDTNNYNQISWSAVTGATGYKVYRTNTAAAPSGTGSYLVGTTAGLSLNDQSNNLSSVTIPALNTTDPRTLSTVRVTAVPSSTVTLAATQVQGNAIVSNPSATQTIIAPSGTGIPLQIKGRNNNSSNVFELYDNQTTPVLRSWFNASGAFTTSQAPTFSSVTSGSLLFPGAGGVLSQDNPNLFWDNTAKRFQVGPRSGFNASYAQGYLDDSIHTFGRIKSAAGENVSALFALEDTSTDSSYAAYAVTDFRHTTGTKPDGGGIASDLFVNVVSPGVITDALGISTFAEHDGTGTTTNLVGLSVGANVRTAGTVVNNYGILVGDQAGVGTNNWAIRTGTGKVQFGDTLALGGNAARTFQMERHTTADTAGNSLTVLAGGATSGATDKNGGDLILSGGTATGTGSSQIQFQTATAGGAGTADRSPTTKMTVLGNGDVGIETTDPTTILSQGGAWGWQGLVVGDTTDTSGIVIQAATNSTLSGVRFSDGEIANYDQGFVLYNHSTDTLALGANRGTRVTVGPTGTTTITQITPGSVVLNLQTTATNDDPTVQTRQDRVATTDATVTTLHTITLTASRTYLIEARVAARRTGGTAGTAEDGAAYVIRGTYKTVTGNATLIGSLNADYTAEDQAAWDATLTMSGANVLLQVTGAANNNVTWHSTVSLSDVGS